MDTLLNTMVYENIVAPREPSSLINDPKDIPILNATVIADVDIIINGA